MKRSTILILFLFVACTHPTHYRWVFNKPVIDETYNYDYGNCLSEARQGAVESVGTNIHPNNLSIFDSITWQLNYDKTFSKCMETKGYNKEN